MKNYFNFCFILAFSMIGISVHVAAQTESHPTVDHTMEINRRKIDSLDKKIITLLGERERAVKEIGIYKAKNNIPSLQANRFQQIVNKGVEDGRKVGLSSEFMVELLNAIHRESLRMEDAIKTK